MHSITNNLTNVTSDNAMTQIWNGHSYRSELTASSGSISSLKVTMGGSDVSSMVCTDNVVFIENVTGDIVITASADE